MEENQNVKKVNLFMIIAIAVIALLLIVSFVQIFQINYKRETLKNQQAQLENLNKQEGYYQNHESNDDHYDIEEI